MRLTERVILYETANGPGHIRVIHVDCQGQRWTHEDWQRVRKVRHVQPILQPVTVRFTNDDDE